MFARLAKFVPKAVTNNADFKVGKNLLCDITGQLPKLAPWGAPLVVLAGWMIYPALTPDFKRSVGLPAVGGSTGSSSIQYEEEIGAVPTEK